MLKVAVPLRCGAMLIVLLQIVACSVQNNTPDVEHYRSEFNQRYAYWKHINNVLIEEPGWTSLSPPRLTGSGECRIYFEDSEACTGRELDLEALVGTLQTAPFLFAINGDAGIRYQLARIYLDDKDNTSASVNYIYAKPWAELTTDCQPQFNRDGTMHCFVELKDGWYLAYFWSNLRMICEHWGENRDQEVCFPFASD